MANKFESLIESLGNARSKAQKLTESKKPMKEAKLSMYNKVKKSLDDFDGFDEIPAFPDGSMGLVMDTDEYEFTIAGDWDTGDKIEVVVFSQDALEGGGDPEESKLFDSSDIDGAISFLKKCISKYGEY